MIEYRGATPADGPALDAMAQQIWRETFAHSASAADVAAYLASAYGANGKLLRHLGDPDYAFRVALADAAIVGYVKLGPLFVADEIDGAGAWQLHQLYIAREWHGRGVAATLMEWAITAARDAGYTSLVLTVWEENARAIRFYTRRGFVHIGDYAFSVGDQIDRDMILRLPL